MSVADWLILGGMSGFFFLCGAVFSWVYWPRRTLDSMKLPALSPSRREREGPYRTVAEAPSFLTRKDFSTPNRPDPLLDMSKAIEDRAAAASDLLRKGKITAFQFGEEIEWLERAAKKLRAFQKTMTGVER